MSFFDCFLAVAWTFAFAWFFGAIYMQNRSEKTQTPQIRDNAEPQAEREQWSVPVLTDSVSAAD